MGTVSLLYISDNYQNKTKASPINSQGNPYLFNTKIESEKNTKQPAK